MTNSKILKNNYNANNIIVLPEIEAVRHNPSMYIGSTDLEGLHHLVYEAVYNSIDESIAGYCSKIEVILQDDGSCSVIDNGRGIPTEIHKKENRPACEVVLTKLHSGGKFGLETYSFTTGIHGVGISCVNALSKKFTLDTWRNGFHYRQSYSYGSCITDLENLGPEDKTGTQVTFLPDSTIFKNLSFSYHIISKRLKELAFLHPGILIKITDKRNNSIQNFKYNTGIIGFIKNLIKSQKVIHDKPLYIKHYSEKRKVEIELAMQWTTEYGENIFSYVNSLNTQYGGTHTYGLKIGLTKSVNTYAQEAKILTNKEQISTFDIFEGLTCVLSINMKNPRFEGQTKTRLTNHELKDYLAKTINTYFLNILRKNSKLATLIVSRALEATRTRISVRKINNIHRHFNFIDKNVSNIVYQKQFGIRSKNWHDSAEWITNSELLSHHVNLLKCDKTARLLDVCCGSGIVGGAFKGKVNKRIGLDITPEMIELAKERLDEVHKGSIYNIPFKNNSFDVVVTREVLHILSNPLKPVSEIYRVLKPGGQFIVGQILPYGAEDATWMYRIFKKKQPLIFNMFQEEDFRHLLLCGGFIDLEMTEYLLWESIDVWINTHETINIHRHEIKDLFYNAPRRIKDIHPFKILPSGEIQDLWRWCIFSAKKPLNI